MVIKFTLRRERPAWLMFLRLRYPPPPQGTVWRRRWLHERRWWSNFVELAWAFSAIREREPTSMCFRHYTSHRSARSRKGEEEPRPGHRLSSRFSHKTASSSGGWGTGGSRVVNLWLWADKLWPSIRASAIGPRPIDHGQDRCGRGASLLVKGRNRKEQREGKSTKEARYNPKIRSFAMLKLTNVTGFFFLGKYGQCPCGLTTWADECFFSPTTCS